LLTKHQTQQINQNQINYTSPVFFTMEAITFLEWIKSDVNPSSLILLTIATLFYGVYRLLTRWPKARPVRFERASRFNPQGIPLNLDTIVIGSGSGGATSANLLAQSGQRVLVLEQHSVTGGCTHSFREENCEWDTGLHYTAMAMSQKTARPGAIMDFMSGGKQKWSPFPPNEPYDEIVFPDNAWARPGAPNVSSYPYMSGLNRCVDNIMENIDPRDKELKKRAKIYMDLCMDIHHGFVALGISRLLPSWLHFLVKSKVDRLMKFAAMTVRDVQHAVLSLGYTPEQLMEEGCPHAPQGEEVDLGVRRLKAVLTHPIGDYAVQPKEATMAAHGVTMAHYLDGGSYTIGPTQNISVHLTSAVRSYGGDVFVDATVRDIIVENGRAVGVHVSRTSLLNACKSDQERATVPMTEVRAKNIVVATSVYNLYNRLLPQDLPVVRKFQDPSTRSIVQSHGHVFLFCKIKGDADEVGLPKHNLWYFNGYDIDSAFDKYFANPTEERPPTVYIGFPCTKDTTWKKRFPGTSNCILISDGLYEWFEKWKDKPVRNRGGDYMDFKEKLSKHLLAILYESVPETKGKVVYHHLGTPLSEITYLASYHAGSYGTKCTPLMFDTINHKWVTTPHTEVPGLYLSGSDAFLPSMTGAMYGGCLGACAVLGYVGSIRLAHAILSHLAKNLKAENPKLSWFQAYREAINKFMDGD
jgi:all-trans-retinol 13,14-reductase